MQPEPELEPNATPAFFFRPLFLALLLAFVLTFVVGAGVGYAVARTPDAAASADTGWWNTFTGQRTATSQCSETQEVLYPAFATFWEALHLLYQDFYGKLPDPEEATYDAIRGIVDELGDPNTSFLTPQEAEFFRTSLQGSFEGIGARVEWDETEDTLRVSEPFENQPAWLAGLRRGDLIVAVDGESIIGTTLNAAVAKIRGKKGTTVVLSIRREGTPDPLEIAVVRDHIETPTIATDTLGAQGEIAYIKLTTFNQNAGQLVRQAVEDALSRSPSALVFDLRGNTGGLLREAIKVANVFIEDSTVLLERFSDGRLETYATTTTAVAKQIPLLVLVDAGSASASEIVAGALQDTGRAKLLGEKTYGKGSVQLPHTLSNGAIMRVTIAHWFTPNDRTIDGTGLAPDIVVELTDQDRENGTDPQLTAAITLLEEEIGQ
ncbi:MAG: S41 family peptidase [Caldilineaceae bacterium]|nr:S41 family peptidase [Caldilineaceae bacterium]